MQQPWRPRPGYLAIALVLAVGAASLLLFLWLWSGQDDATGAAVLPAPSSTPVPAQAAGAGGMARSVAQRAPVPMPEGDADPTPDLKSYVARGEAPSMAEVIDRLHARGIQTGLGAFSPPGTSPPLVGIAVPEDFALPKGYVRHHQVTDDGQPIEAVLMFAPDFQPRDAANRPIAVPKDRVVPPELVPPGLPIRRITIPAPLEPPRPGR